MYACTYQTSLMGASFSQLEIQDEGEELLGTQNFYLSR